MIAYTVAQAADQIFQDVAVIEQWIITGVLIAVRNPIDGHRYIEEEHLLDVEQAMRVHGTAPVSAPSPRPIDGIAQWLWDHGRPVTISAVRDWAHRRDLTPVVPGRRGRGGAALYDPLQALTVHASKIPRVGTLGNLHDAQ